MAKRFTFRLEKVLQHRQIVRDEKKKDLMLANNALYEAEVRLEALEAALHSNELASGGALSVGEIELIDHYSSRLRAEIQHQKERVAEAEAVVEAARAAYIEAARDAESLERLKQKKKEEYRVYLEKENEKFLDELTTQRTGFLRAKE